MLYFAYGSNMDQKRMIERECKFEKVVKAILEDFALTFDKKSLKIPGVTFANIVEKPGSIVEGMLYTIDDDKIKFLDKFEGHPKHYLRTVMNIKVEDKIVKAHVYVAQKEWIDDGLPTKEYMSHLLAGKDFLSESYYAKLQNTKTMKDVSESHIMNFEDFLFEKFYEKTYTKNDIVKHLKMFKKYNVDPIKIDKKILNFYNYSANFLMKKYPGYDILKSSQEGPADEEYMKILDKLVAKIENA